MTRRLFNHALSLLLAALVLLQLAPPVPASTSAPFAIPVQYPLPPDMPSGTERAVLGALGGLEPAFIENRGQMGVGAGRLYAEGHDLSVALGDGWMAYRVHQDGAEVATLIRVEFLGSNRCRPVGLEPLDRTSSFLLGATADEWYSAVPSFAAARYAGLWDGIDMELRFADGILKYEFRVGPGADPSRIRLRYTGADGLRVDPGTGDLLVATPGGVLIDLAPTALPEGDAPSQAVPCAFYLAEDATVTFELGDHDPSRALVIDPGIAFSTYLGTDGSDGVSAIAVDGYSRCYLFGETHGGPFPMTPGAYQWNLTSEAGLYLIGMDANLSRLELSVYIGLDSPLVGRDMAIGDDGCYYLAAHGVDTAFPATDGAFDTSQNGETDGFVMKLDANASRLVYATYVGGNSYDFPFGIAVDGTGRAIVVGNTYSSDFPTTELAYDRMLDGSDAGFLLELSPDGSTLEYSTLIDSGGSTSCEAVEMLPSGEVLVAGATTGESFYISTNAYDRTFNGYLDGFLMRFNLSSCRQTYSTYIGGSALDGVDDIAVDGEGDVYLVGITYSRNFPTTPGAYDTALGGKMDAFVTKLNASLSTLEFSTYMGGSGDDLLYGIGLDPEGQVAVTGITRSTDYPVTRDATRENLGGPQDASFTILHGNGSALVYSSYLGGNTSDEGISICCDNAGFCFVAGSTQSKDFPTTEQAYDSDFSGATDVFVARLYLRRPCIVSIMFPTKITTGDVAAFGLEASSGTAIANATLEHWIGNDTTHANLTLSLSGEVAGIFRFDGVLRAPEDRIGDFNYILHVVDVTGSDNDSIRGSIPLLDNDAPTLSFPEPPLRGYGKDFAICGTIRDNVGVLVTNLTVWFGSDEGMPVMVRMDPLADNFTYRGTVSAPPGFVGWMAYVIEAVDTSGNRNTTIRYVANIRDELAPEVLIDRSDRTATTGDPFVFAVVVRDDVMVASVNVLYWFGDPDVAETHNASMRPSDVSGRGNGTYVLEGFRMPVSFVGTCHYSFLVTDASGNILRTTPVPVQVSDNDPPQVMADGAIPDATTGDPWTVEVTVMDNIAVSSVVLWCDIPGLASSKLAMAGRDVDGQGNGAYTITVGVPIDWAGPFNCTVEAIDVYGNRLETGPFAHMVLDNDAPSIAAVGTVPGAAVKGLVLQVLADGADNIGPPEMSVEFWFSEGEHMTVPMVRDADRPLDPRMPYSASIQVPRQGEALLWFIVSATDGAGNTISTEARMLLLVNLVPSVDPLPEWTVTEGAPSTLDLSPYIRDGNDPVDALSVTVVNESITCDGLVLTALFERWFPTGAVTLNVSDGESWTSAIITLHMVDVNDAPKILGTVPTSGASFAQGERIVFHADVTDEDNDPITLTWFDGPGLMGTGQDLGVDLLIVGEHTIRVVASDGNDESTLDIIVTVTERAEEGTLHSIIVMVVIVVLVVVAVSWYMLRRQHGSDDKDGS